MFFGVFGAIFLISQYFQTAQGYAPFEAGARTLPWTGIEMVIAPIAGLLAARIGTRPPMFVGLALQAIGLAWLAMVLEPDTPLVDLIGPFAVSGIGMALVFPTAAEAVLAAVRRDDAGKASGATNSIREIGGVMGVAVLATVFAANGGYESPQAFTDGVVAALPVAVVVLAAGALLALLTPGRVAVDREKHQRARMTAPAEAPETV
jgi:MFS family permease